MVLIVPNPFAYQQRLDRRRLINQNRDNIKCSIEDCGSLMNSIIDNIPYCVVHHNKLFEELSKKPRPNLFEEIERKEKEKNG